MRFYVGILDGSGDTWGVRIPDIAGCVGAGATPEAAIAGVTQALRDVAEYKRKGDYALPAARSLAEVIAAAEVGEGETSVLIPLILDAGRTVRANVSFDAGLLEAIDEEADRRGVTRAAFLASAAREKIEALR